MKVRYNGHETVITPINKQTWAPGDVKDLPEGEAAYILKLSSFEKVVYKSPKKVVDRHVYTPSRSVDTSTDKDYPLSE